MNSYSTHGDLLADRLSRLDVDLSPKLDHQPVQAPVTDDTTHPPKPPYDGYGFRPASGMSSPRIQPPPDRNSPLPDVNGLGWPGQSSFLFPSSPPPPAPAYPVFLLQIHKQSRPSLASTHLPKRNSLAKLDSLQQCAPSSNASARIPIEKDSFARQNAMPRP